MKGLFKKMKKVHFFCGISKGFDVLPYEHQ